MKTPHFFINKNTIIFLKLAYSLFFFVFVQSIVYGQSIVGPNDRIAYTADGNAVDPDDWSATPLSLAIFAHAGLHDKLVHFDYNSRLDTRRNADKERENNESTLGAMERFGFNPDIFFNDREDLAGSINSLTNAINASSVTSKLWVVMAGPFELLYRALEQADEDKRQYVMMVTHSWVNEQRKRDFDHGRTDCEELGAVYHPVRTGNGCYNAFGASSCTDWSLVDWLLESPNENYNWVYSRLRATWFENYTGEGDAEDHIGKIDGSDATMAYYLAYNDEEGNFEKLRYKFEDLGTPPPQPYVRITAPDNGAKVSIDDDLTIQIEAWDSSGINRITTYLRNTMLDRDHPDSGYNNQGTQRPADGFVWEIDKSVWELGTWVIRTQAINGNGDPLITEFAIDIVESPILSVSTNSNADNNLKIYPNPVNAKEGILTIENIDSYSEVSLFDMTGKVITYQKMPENKFDVSIKDVTAGIYFLRLANQQTTITKKIIVR